MPIPLSQYADDFAEIAALRLLELRLHTTAARSCGRRRPIASFRSSSTGSGTTPTTTWILVGTGDDFLADVDFSTWGGVRNAQTQVRALHHRRDPGRRDAHVVAAVARAEPRPLLPDDGAGDRRAPGARARARGRVLPPDRLLDRAWEIARRFNERPFLSLRYTRLCLTLGLKSALFNELESGLAIESLGRVGMMATYPLIRDEGLGDRPVHEEA